MSYNVSLGDCQAFGRGSQKKFEKRGLSLDFTPEPFDVTAGTSKDSTGRRLRKVFVLFRERGKWDEKGNTITKEGLLDNDNLKLDTKIQELKDLNNKVEKD